MNLLAVGAAVAQSSAVHTTGINLEGLAATVSSITVVLVTVIGVVGWALRNASREDTRKVVKELMGPQFAAIAADVTDIKSDIAEIRQFGTRLDSRVAYLEGRSGRLADDKQS